MHQQCMVTALLEHRAGGAVALRLQLTEVTARAAFRVRREEDLGVDGATDAVVLPFPVSSEWRRQPTQVGHDSPPRSAFPLFETGERRLGQANRFLQLRNRALYAPDTL
jgi:hypothetical protein